MNKIFDLDLFLINNFLFQYHYNIVLLNVL